jgi:hypothetical protein
MRSAKPAELKENAFPVITARISEAELERWFPFTFQEITDPWATPEPSRGALIKLDAGQYVVLYWGRDSKELAVHIPVNVDPSAFLASFFNEVPLPRSRVLWRRKGVHLPRNVAAKRISAPSIRRSAAHTKRHSGASKRK